MKNYHINLGPYWRIIYHIAELRNNIQINRKVENKRISERTDFMLNRYGVAGEIAVCLYFGIGFKQVWELEYSGSGKDYDLKIGDKKIEIKHNTWHYGDLYLNPKIHKKHQKSDIYILTTDNKCGFPHIVDIPGWLSRKEFLSSYEEKDYGYGSVWAVPQNKLNPMDSFPKL